MYLKQTFKLQSQSALKCVKKQQCGALEWLFISLCASIVVF